MELIIGLVISSVIITMVYQIFTNISRQIVQYAKDQNELREFNQFQQLFYADIHLCKQLLFVNQSHIKLMMRENEIDYFFKDSLIQRLGKAKDNFAINVLEVIFNSNDKVSEDYQTIKLKTNILGEEVVIFEVKKISLAAQLNSYFLSEH